MPLLQSGIHGWGLFARKQLKQDSMVIEYRGDLLRRTAADAREKAYQAAGKDCYLFTVNEDCVIDATMKGGIGRFTVSLAASLRGQGAALCMGSQGAPHCHDTGAWHPCRSVAVRPALVIE